MNAHNISGKGTDQLSALFSVMTKNCEYLDVSDIKHNLVILLFYAFKYIKKTNKIPYRN